MRMAALHPIDARLDALGISLPARSRPAGNYLAACRCNTLLFISGQFPLEDGRIKYAGRVGCELTPEQGYQAARLSALNALAHLRHETNGWRDLESVLRIDGHISSASDFYDQPKVLDGASDLLAQVLESRSGHARTVFAHTSLPLNSSVELVVIACLKPSP